MVRTGIGYDVHRLVEGRPLILGGVTICHEKGLLGHSDADVAIHALADAILGALAFGDIGTHFPDTDAKYKDADSTALLRKVVEMVDSKGWKISNVDISILCEKPKLSPHIPEMRKRIASAMCSNIDSVSIKATTGEGLGFVGRKEGIAAMAVATIYNDW